MKEPVFCRRAFFTLIKKIEKGEKKDGYCKSRLACWFLPHGKLPWKQGKSVSED
jgi:hypothetical protein